MPLTWCEGFCGSIGESVRWPGGPITGPVLYIMVEKYRKCVVFCTFPSSVFNSILSKHVPSSNPVTGKNFSKKKALRYREIK
jgi:hypothetical protein